MITRILDKSNYIILTMQSHKRTHLFFIITDYYYTFNACSFLYYKLFDASCHIALYNFIVLTLVLFFFSLESFMKIKTKKKRIIKNEGKGAKFLAA